MIGVPGWAGELLSGGAGRRPGWLPGRDTRAERLPAPEPRRAVPLDPAARHVAVVGGGIAGIAAAAALMERGVAVTLVEAGDRLGGRAGSWPVTVPGDPSGRATMSRGFHAYFRQYYNLRSLLRRIDPGLHRLAPVRDYPLVHADGSRDSFTRVPRQPPANIVGFVALSPSFGPLDLPRVNLARALELLDVDFPATFSAYDGVSAAQVLDRLGFPQGMRDLALEVFARSFFADPREFSGGELVAMFHAYFLGSAEGLLFDVPVDDPDRTWWAPLRGYLERGGATLRLGTSVTAVAVPDPEPGRAPGAAPPGPRPTGRVLLELGDGSSLEADAVVLATDRARLQRLVAASPGLGDAAWRAAVAGQRVAPRFLVQRLWLDRPARPDAPVFLGTAGFGRLDNVSLTHRMEQGAAQWARETGGSVVELHAYALPAGVADEAVLADLGRQFERLHPELAEAEVVHEEVLVRADCPLPGLDPWADRPGVRTPDPRVVLAGDGVRCELPVALMERAATTGFQAANALLGEWGLPGHELWTVPTTGRFGAPVTAARRLAGALPHPSRPSFRR